MPGPWSRRTFPRDYTTQVIRNKHTKPGKKRTRRSLTATNASFGSIFSLADMPVGFKAQVRELSPLDPSVVMITTYHNSWITRYTRPIKATGDLTVVEAMDISCQKISTKQGSIVTQDQVEVVN